MLSDSTEKKVFSEEHEEEERLQVFLQYLSKSDIAEALLRYLVQLRSCTSFPENPLEIMKNTFNAQNNPKLEHYEKLIAEFQVLKKENELLNLEKAELEDHIEMEHQMKLREEENSETEGAK